MRIAVVDDFCEDADRLATYLAQFQEEKGVTMQIDTYYSSVDFLEKFHAQYDVLLLDIEMPGCNGLDVAREVRAKDSSAGLIFITGMAQYALHGYEVNASDFIVKPVQYVNFVEKLTKAIQFRERHIQKSLLLSNENGVSRIIASDLLYVEKDRYYLIYHTKDGIFRSRGTAKELKARLEGLPFSDCTVGCIVNLDQVKRVEKECVVLYSGESLPIARRLRKQFLQDFIKFAGGGFLW